MTKLPTFTVKATRQGTPARFLPNAIIVDGYVFLTYQVGVGKAIEKGGMNSYGEGETWEEYKSYRTCYKPIIQGQKFKDAGFDNKLLEKEQTTMSPQQLITKYGTCMVQMGDNDGLLIENKEEAERKEVEANKTVHIRNGFDGYLIQERLPSDLWSKLKPHAKFWKAADIDEYYDDMDDFHLVGEGRYLSGWNYKEAIVPILVKEGWKVIYMDQQVKNTDDIRAIDERKRMEADEQQRKANAQYAELQRLKKQFSEFERELPKHEQIKGVSKLAELLFLDAPGANIYGSGYWFNLDDNYLYYVVNNGMDGDDWSRSNYYETGGAGAVCYRIKRDDGVNQWIADAEKWKSNKPN